MSSKKRDAKAEVKATRASKRLKIYNPLYEDAEVVANYK